MKNTFYLLSRRYFELLMNKELTEKIAIVMKAPLFAFLILIVAEDDAFINYNSTKTILFILACSAVFLGISNALQEVCKERAIVKRELQSKAYNPLEYVISKLFVLSIIGIVQSIILVLPLIFIGGISTGGVLTGIVFIDMVIATFIAVICASAMSLFISALARNTDSTMNMMPILILAQLLFAGVLIRLDGAFMHYASYLTISRWLMGAYGSIVNLNSMHMTIQNTVFGIIHEPEALYIYSTGNLLKNLVMLLYMFGIFTGISAIAVGKITNDGR